MRLHKGVDIVVKPGETVYSPVEGTVERTDVKPYAKDAYRGISIRTEDGHRVRILYVTPHIKTGAHVKAGSPVGTAQDLLKRYPPRKKGEMTNHVHVDVKKDGAFKNPSGMLFGR